MTNTNNWNILVIEDENDSMELVRSVLEYHGISSIGASTAEEALDILQAIRPTLIVCDLALPSLDGWGLLRQVRENPSLSNVPCVAITAFHSPELAQQAIAAGFEAYFAKPIDATVFVRELEGIITR